MSRLTVAGKEPDRGSRSLVQNAGDQTSSDSPTALTDIEALAGLKGKRMVNLADHLDIVARHDHLRVLVFGALGPSQ